MWDIKEEDLDEFKITCRNRLSPEAAVGFMLGSIIYTSLIMLGVIYGLVKFGWSVYPSLLDEAIIKIELCLYSIQIIFLIVYLFPKARFKLQKLQAIVILLYALQLATIGFVTVVVSSIFGYSNDRVIWTYVALLLLLFIFLQQLIPLSKLAKAHLVSGKIQFHFLVRQKIY